MRKEPQMARPLASAQASLRRTTAAAKATSYLLSFMLVLPSLFVGSAVDANATTTTTATQRQSKASATTPDADDARPVQATTTTTKGGAGRVYTPARREIKSFAPVNFAERAEQEALAPAQESISEIRAIDAPRGDRPVHGPAPKPDGGDEDVADGKGGEQAPPPSPTGQSPAPSRTFKGEFLSATSIPPDTMGAIGDNHTVNVTNNNMSIQTRDGAQISRMTMTSFWTGVTIKGVAVSAFDPKVMYDRFNDRYMLISTFNAQSISSGAGFAVSQTNDPTGMWNRFTVEADPASTAGGGLWIDYPSMGFNKNWIVINYNTFGYGTVTGYQRSDIFVLDKQAAYANTLTSISAFQGLVSTCNGTGDETNLGCGFTMNPTVNEDNVSETVYLVEDWDSTGGQLRMSKITGTPAAPVLTVGTQFPQSPNSWRFNASRIGPSSGGYAPQRQQAANLPSGTRIMANDSRIQNAVLRNGSLWTTHTVMLAATPTAAGVGVGGAANPDIRAAVQWWQIDPTQETGMSNAASVLQRGRIEDPTANNCHNGSAGLSTVPTCDTTLEQVGEFFAFPNIGVNVNNDVLIGYTKFSPLTYPNAAYSMRLAADPINTLRDQVVFRPGQANYNLGAGTGATRQNRWGDYSATQTDPLNDTDFWTVQEYAGTVRDFGIGLAGNWETWWALVRPSSPLPVTNGSLIISEFRLRGPQGVRDEFVELYNPSSSPIIVNTTDNSDGWALVKSNDGTAITSVFAVIPNGTVIQPFGHFLVANNPDGATAPTLVYSLNNYPSQPTVRGADSDVGYSLDLADNGGIALFRTATTANFNTTTRIDSVGFVAAAAGLFKEGAGLPDLLAVTPAGQPSFVRRATSGSPQDTQDNAADFVFVDTMNETTLGVTPTLGAPGPQNLDGPRQNNASIALPPLDPGIGNNVPPNRVRLQCIDAEECDPNRSAFGTLSLRKRVVNNTSAPVTRLRFRVVDITGFPTPNMATADMRPITSNQIMVMLSGGGGTTTVEGTTLEAPPTQALGGGLNSSLGVGTITLATPLAAGGTLNVQFLLGVQQRGNFRFFVNIEALP